jgi:hypothetical protein
LLFSDLTVFAAAVSEDKQIAKKNTKNTDAAIFFITLPSF